MLQSQRRMGDTPADNLAEPFRGWRLLPENADSAKTVMSRKMSR